MSREELTFCVVFMFLSSLHNVAVVTMIEDAKYISY